MGRVVLSHQYRGETTLKVLLGVFSLLARHRLTPETNVNRDGKRRCFSRLHGPATTVRITQGQTR